MGDVTFEDVPESVYDHRLRYLVYGDGGTAPPAGAEQPT